MEDDILYEDWEWEDEMRVEERNNLRNRPISKEQLESVFSNSKFSSYLKKGLDRVEKMKAESGLIVYLDLENNDVFFVYRDGTDRMSSRDEGPKYYREMPHASVNLKDEYKELQSIGITNTYNSHIVRVGTIHYHDLPAGFSEADIANFENHVTTNRDNEDFVAPASKAGFKMIAYKVKGANGPEVELFGISLPGGTSSLKSTEYQTASPRDIGKQHEALEKSGFKVVRTRIPVDNRNVIVSKEKANELAQLGT